MRFLCAPKFGQSGKDHGAIAIKVHRPIKGRMKSCTITREGDAWYACVVTAIRCRKSVPEGAAASRLEAVGEIDPILPHKTRQRTIDAERQRRKAAWAEAIVAVNLRLHAEELAKTKIVGVDRNVTHPYVTSDGAIAGGDFLTPKLRRQVAKLQRKLARKLEALRKANGIPPGGALRGIRFGANIRKILAKLRALQAKVSRRRKDTIHKVTTDLVRRADIIVLEDLRLQNMTATAKGTAEEPGRNVAQKSGLNRALLDKGHGFVRQCLEYKVKRTNRVGAVRKAVIHVDPSYTSQTCFACGHRQSENRSESTFLCLGCGHMDHADINAAKNIRERGLERLAHAFGTDGITLSPMLEQLVAGGSPGKASQGQGRRAPVGEEQKKTLASCPIGA